VLIPAPAIITIFLHFSSLIKLTISTIFLVVTLVKDLFFGERVLGFLSGGLGCGVIERLLNCDESEFSDWLFLMFFLVTMCRFWLDGLVVDRVVVNRLEGDLDGDGVRDILDRAFRIDFIIIPESIKIHILMVPPCVVIRTSMSSSSSLSLLISLSSSYNHPYHHHLTLSQ